VIAEVLTTGFAVLALCAFSSIIFLAFHDSDTASGRLHGLYTTVWMPVLPGLGYFASKWWRAAIRRKLRESNADIVMVSIT
jgi:hypothetical protein